MREIGTLRATWRGWKLVAVWLVRDSKRNREQKIDQHLWITPASILGNGSRPIHMLASLFSRNHPRETASHPRLNAGSKSPQIEVRLTANYLTQSLNTLNRQSKYKLHLSP